MSESEGAERTEPATAKRLREARERGQVPRSRELGGAAVLGASVLMLSMNGASIMHACLRWMRNALTFTAADIVAPDLAAHAGAELLAVGIAFAPLMAVGVVTGAIAPALVSGINFSGKALLPDFSRVDPMAGLRRLGSGNSLAEIAKAMLRVALVGSIGWISLRGHLPELVGLTAEAPAVAVAHGAAVALDVLVMLVLALVGIAAIDVPYQLWHYHHSLRMTREEVRDEMRESEGRPEVRARIRRAQHAASTRRMLDAVPKADAVIVNPTHYAVAIAYHADRMRAPRVVAKGVDLIAEAIRDVAEKHRVPIVSAPPLARALYAQVDFGREVPVKLYAAVASVLTFVYQLRAYRRHGGRRPELARVDVPVDAEQR